jgi:redox-sensitive bicupin YhaK (pirin superfamily)
MIQPRRSDERGHAQHGWLESYHSFSFADYHDPDHMGFRSLRVINEDRVAPGMGFPTHPHRDMEIITYVLSGALRHEDSLGHRAVMRAGDVQRISAGTGIQHSEFNASTSDPVHLLQIWIIPNIRGATPHYAERSLGTLEQGLPLLVASGTGRDGSLPINQDAALWAARLDAGQTIQHPLENGHHAWIQVIEGSLKLGTHELHAGDAAAVSDEHNLEISSLDSAHFLLFELA